MSVFSFSVSLTHTCSQAQCKQAARVEQWRSWSEDTELFIQSSVTLSLHNTDILSTCISSNTEFTHFDHVDISLHVGVMLYLCIFQPCVVGRLVPVSVSMAVFILMIFPVFPQHLLPFCPFLLSVLCHGLCLHVSTSSCLRDSCCWTSMPLLQKWQAKRARGLKLLRGISTSHYLLASMHPTHPSLGELQSTTHHEYKPQS